MITIYSKKDCPKCEQLKDVCKQASVEYSEVDTTGNMELINLLREKAEGMGFPMVKFPDGKILAGDLEAIFQNLNSAEQKVEQKKDPNENIEYDWGFKNK